MSYGDICNNWHNAKAQADKLEVKNQSLEEELVIANETIKKLRFEIKALADLIIEKQKSEIEELRRLAKNPKKDK